MLALLLALAPAVWADQAADAYKLFKAGKYDEAYKLALPLAQKGDDGAQYTVGAVLEERDRIPEAMAWYEKASSANAYGALRLGDIYERGRKGVKPDATKAAAWYQKAADGGEPESTRRLADMYLYGKGVAADPAKAFRYVKFAAEDGSPRHQYNLGLMYGKAKGVRQDAIECYRWIWAAAQQGYPQAKQFIASLETKVSAVDAEKAKRRHREWLERKDRPKPQ